MNQVDESNNAALDRFCLARLERFARLASQPELDAVPQWRRLARHATLASYRDCVAWGLGDEAAQVVASTRRAGRPAGRDRAGRQARDA